MTTALSSARERALELAVAFTRDIDAVTEPAEVVKFAESFHTFLTAGENPTASATSTPAAQTGSADASPASDSKPAPAASKPAAAAKPATKAADKPATTKAAEKPAETAAEKPAAKAGAKEPTMAEAQQAVVKLVTKIGRDPTIKFMKDTFGSPNVSGLDLSKHSYAGVIKTIAEHIKSLDEAAAEQSPAE